MLGRFLRAYPMRLLRPAFALILLPVATAAHAQSSTNTTLTITSGGATVASVKEESEVTLTASVIAGSTPITRGQVNFCEPTPQPLKCTDIRLLGTAQLTSNGTAVFSFYPPAGSHSYQAVFVGTHTDAPSSASETLLVSPFIPTVTTITNPDFIASGTYTFDVLVTASGGTVSPTGTVSILDQSNNNYVLGTAPVVSNTSSSNPSTGSGFSTPVLSTVANFGYPTVADFNGDGKNDVALPGFQLGIALGNGDGTFTSAPSVNLAASSVSVADFNGDGKPDVAIESQSGVWIVLGNGDGTFGGPTKLPASFGPAPSFIACADLNGDGIPDLAVTNTVTLTGTVINTLTILLGNGDGTFTLKSTIPTGSYPRSVTVGDFNDDGIPDLAVINDGPPDVAVVSSADKAITVMLGNGDGTFQPLAPIPSTGFSEYPQAITTADFNLDGKLDLVVINSGSPETFDLPGSIWVLLGNGDGTFTPQIEMIGRNGLNSIAIGDFNADGKPDLVLSGLALVNVLFGNGDGTFGPQLTPALVGGAGGAFAVATGDFNGDGIADIVVPTYTTAPGIVPPPIPPIPTPSYIETVLSEIGQQTGTSSAVATVSDFFVVGTGFHNLVAAYSGDNNYTSSTSASQAVTAEPEPTTLSLSASPATSNYQQPVLLTAVAAPITAQDHSATGTVTFTYGTTVIGTSTMVGGTTSFTTAMLPSGVDTITGTYNGDTNFAVSTGTTTETVNGSQTVTTLTIVPNPALVGQTVTLAATVTGVSLTKTPTGSVTFYAGTTALAQVPLTTTGTATYSTSAFPFGTYVITAVYSGDPAFNPSTSTPTTLVIGGYASATTLTVSPNPAGTGQTVTLTAAVTGVGSTAIAMGTVKFYDGTTAIGTGTLDPTGHATLATSTLTLGTHSLTAAFAGSSSYSASTSASYSEVIQNPAFTLTLSSPTITLAKYQHITTTVTLTSSGDFADKINLTCTSPPANLTCIFTPAPAPLAAESTTSVSFYLDTDSILGGNFTGPLANSARISPSSIALALLLSPLGLFAVLAARRRRPRATLSLVLLAIACLAFAFTGCGSSVITPVPGTPPGTYTITITGTGTTTGVTHTAQLTLTVTP